MNSLKHQPMYQRGDIVSVPFPFTDLSQVKLRPALVISGSIVNDSGDVILVMITSVSKADGISISISVDNVSIPLPKNSFVRCHKVVTISQSLIQKTISKARIDFVDQIADKIQSLIGATSYSDLS